MSFILEACVDTLDASIRAFKNEASQIELCSRLDLDGLTPSFELTEMVVKAVSCPVKIMIRCREGHFYYSDNEIAEMKKMILEFKKLAIGGFVFGALTPMDNDLHNNVLDMDAITQICDYASPFPVTIHKAIDLCTDPVEEIHRFGKLGIVHSVLSSGGKESAIEGLPMLNNMHRAALMYGVHIIAAGKITKDKLNYLKSNTSITHFHGKRITELSQ